MKSKPKVEPKAEPKAKPKAELKAEQALLNESGLRSISGLRNKLLMPFTLRDHAPLLSPSNPDNCGWNRTA